MLKFAMLTTVAVLGFAVPAAADNGFQILPALTYSGSPHNISFAWTGDTTTTSVVVSRLDAGGWVGLGYLPNNPNATQWNRALFGNQPSGVHTYRLCLDKSMTVCTASDAVTVR